MSLFFLFSGGHAQKVGSLSQTLTLTEIVSYTVRRNVSLTQSLTLTQTVTRRATQTGTLSQSLTFSQTITRTSSLARKIIQSITLTQQLRTANPRLIVTPQTLSLTETINLVRRAASRSEQTLSFLDTIGLKKIYKRSITDTLVFPNTLTKQLPIAHLGFVWPNQVAFVAPKQCLVTLTDISGNLTTILPCPLFKDSIADIPVVSVKRAMNGRTYTYVKSSTLNKLAYTFELTYDKSLELKNFIDINHSNLIVMKNWRGEIWYTYITNNPVDFITKGREEYVEVTLDFEGTRVF